MHGARRFAAHGGHHEIATALLAAGANIDQARNDGATPLCLAVAVGHVEVVRLLVRAGADSTLGDNNGPPIDQICKDPSAEKANEAEIRAILLQATTTAAAALDSTFAYPPLMEMVRKFKETTGVEGETAPVIVDGTCATLSVDTAGLSLSEKAQRCYDVLYRAAPEGAS